MPKGFGFSVFAFIAVCGIAREFRCCREVLPAVAINFDGTLNFRKFKVALNSMYRIFLNFAKSCILSCLSNSIIRKNFTVPFLKYKRLKLKLRVFLAGHSVAMVTSRVTKIIPTCSPMIGQFFDTMIVAAIDRVVIMTHRNLRLGKCWKLF